jgi:hypothetical protein
MAISASKNLYTPEVLPVIASGQTPAYSAFPFASSNRDLQTLLSNPGSDFANNVESAANGTLTGIVYNGDIESLVYDMMSCGRQMEATQEWQREQRKSEKPEKSDKTAAEALLSSEEIQHSEEKAANDNVRDDKSKDKSKSSTSVSSLSGDTLDAVSAIGKMLSGIVQSEFTISVPEARINDVAPTRLHPSIALVSKSASPAFSLHC